jgi:hypothetical protein
VEIVLSYKLFVVFKLLGFLCCMAVWSLWTRDALDKCGMTEYILARAFYLHWGVLRMWMIGY